MHREDSRKQDFLYGQDYFCLLFFNLRESPRLVTLQPQNSTVPVKDRVLAVTPFRGKAGISGK